MERTEKAHEKAKAERDRLRDALLAYHAHVLTSEGVDFLNYADKDCRFDDIGNFRYWLKELAALPGAKAKWIADIEDGEEVVSERKYRDENRAERDRLQETLDSVTKDPSRVAIMDGDKLRPAGHIVAERDRLQSDLDKTSDRLIATQAERDRLRDALSAIEYARGEGHEAALFMLVGNIRALLDDKKGGE